MTTKIVRYRVVANVYLQVIFMVYEGAGFSSLKEQLVCCGFYRRGEYLFVLNIDYYISIMLCSY